MRLISGVALGTYSAAGANAVEATPNASIPIEYDEATMVLGVMCTLGAVR